MSATLRIEKVLRVVDTRTLELDRCGDCDRPTHASEGVDADSEWFCVNCAIRRGMSVAGVCSKCHQDTDSLRPSMAEDASMLCDGCADDERDCAEASDARRSHYGDANGGAR